MTWITKLPEPFEPEQKQAEAPVFENEQALKLAFAASLMRSPDDPFKAALAVIDASRNAGPAMYAANYWPFDPDVKAEVERLREEKGELAFLPTKADLARSLWEKAHGERTSNDDFVKIARLYAEILDFIPKQSKVAIDAKNSVGASVRVVASDLDENL